MLQKPSAWFPYYGTAYVAYAIYEPDARDMDVHAIHHGFLRALRARGGTLVTKAEVLGVDRLRGAWNAQTNAGGFTAPVVVNAAGAWADEIARRAGVADLGLAPKRRTAMVFDVPEGVDPTTWPATVDVDEQFYFKPEAGCVLASPADETPSPPCDAQPEEIDLAITVDHIERATTLKIHRIARRWAGLRTFVADKTPVVGTDPDADGFFWLAGQRGYGIFTSPAMAQAAAALATGRDLPENLRALGLSATDLAPRPPSILVAC